MTYSHLILIEVMEWNGLVSVNGSPVVVFAGGVVLNPIQVEPNSVERAACNVKKNIMIFRASEFTDILDY